MKRSRTSWRISHGWILVTASAASALMLQACRSPGPGPYSDTGDTLRDPTRAAALHAHASSVVERDPELAERLLRQALDADLYHGAAHNNLGLLLLEQGRLYEAASEFEWARKLMPGHPGPRTNLAMTLERAGRIDDAFEAYDNALAAWEMYLPAVKGKARLMLAHGGDEEQVRVLLDLVALRGDPEWRRWARSKLISLDQ